jgi:hypothetical protein
LDSLTRATLRRAELGFLVVMVLTTVTTPLLNGFMSVTKRLSLALKDRRMAEALTFLIFVGRLCLMS